MHMIERDQRFVRTGAVETVELSRRQLLALVVLTCVPVPLLTVGGLAAPFPELAQRALAPLLPFIDMPGAESSPSWPEAVRTVSIVRTGAEQADTSLPGGSVAAPRPAPLSRTPIGSAGRAAREATLAPIAPATGADAVTDPAEGVPTDGSPVEDAATEPATGDDGASGTGDPGSSSSESSSSESSSSAPAPLARARAEPEVEAGEARV